MQRGREREREEWRVKRGGRSQTKSIDSKKWDALHEAKKQEGESKASLQAVGGELTFVTDERKRKKKEKEVSKRRLGH